MPPTAGNAKMEKERRRKDSFYHLAKEQGYRSRAAMKLLELNRSFRFLPTARAVLDLGASPGGWLQVVVRGATPGAFVVGVDLARIRPIRGAISIREDITATARCSAAVQRFMDSRGVTAFDVVLHDGDGKRKKRKRDGEEATRQSALVIDAVHLATMFLAPKGTFITKFIGPYDSQPIKFCLKQLFNKVLVAKPAASRSTLPEVYFICLEYKAPARIEPELFDLKHLLTAGLKNKVTMRGSLPWRAGRASDFVWSEAKTLQELLVSFIGVSFDDPACLPIKNHELTTDKIRMFCKNLDILDEETLNYIWEWRMRIRKALSSCSQVTPKADVTAVDAKVKDDGQLLDKNTELTRIIARKTRSEKPQSSCRAKDKAHKTRGMQTDATEDGHCNADLLSVCAIKELRAVDSVELDMEDGIPDGGEEETQTHEGSNEEMDSGEEQHRYEGMLDEAHEGFMIKNGEVKQQQQRKHTNPINTYANADLLEKPKDYVVAKKRFHAVVRDYKGKALVDPRMKDKNFSGFEKKVGDEDAKRRRGRIASIPGYNTRLCKITPYNIIEHM